MILEREAQLKIVVDGAAVLVVGLLCGYAALAEEAAQAGRSWLAAHAALLTLGI